MLLSHHARLPPIPGTTHRFIAQGHCAARREKYSLQFVSGDDIFSLTHTLTDVRTDTEIDLFGEPVEEAVYWL